MKPYVLISIGPTLIPYEIAFKVWPINGRTLMTYVNPSYDSTTPLIHRRIYKTNKVVNNISIKVLLLGYPNDVFQEISSSKFCLYSFSLPT
jgi:hypothetical protein